jgi:uncharacterized integral membrane protein
MTSPGDPKKIDYTRPPNQAAAPASGTQPTPPPAPKPAHRGVAWTTYAITIVAFILVIIVVVFITQNTTRIPIKFFGSTHYQSVAGALAGSAVVGFVAGGLLALVPQLRLRRELRALRKANR